VDTSAAVTRAHASTFEYTFTLGAGEGVTAAFEEELDDPQATKRPHVATTAIKPLAEMVLAAALTRLIWGRSVPRGQPSVKRIRVC
jgi:hypothetical protein